MSRSVPDQNPDGYVPMKVRIPPQAREGFAMFRRITGVRPSHLLSVVGGIMYVLMRGLSALEAWRPE